MELQGNIGFFLKNRKDQGSEPFMLINRRESKQTFFTGKQSCQPGKDSCVKRNYFEKNMLKKQKNAFLPRLIL